MSRRCPRVLDVPFSGGVAALSAKGSRCPCFRTQAPPDRRTGTGYCSTCRLVPAERTREALAELLGAAPPVATPV